MEEKEMKASYSLCYEDQFDIEDDEQRKIMLNSEIDEDIVSTIVYTILRFNIIDKGKQPEDRKPIFIYINSPGGSVIDGLSLVDAITNSKTPVYTINLALAASMAFHIFIAGHKRFSMPNSIFLSHQGESASWGTASQVRERVEFESNELANVIKSHVLTHTNIDDKLYEHKYKTEWYFLPKVAKEVGVVDYIVGEDCDIDAILPSIEKEVNEDTNIADTQK